MIKKFAQEKKEREKRLMQQRRVTAEKYAEVERFQSDMIEQTVARAKEERLQGIKMAENRINYRQPFAQRRLQQIRDQQQFQQNLESGSVGQ